MVAVNRAIADGPGRQRAGLAAASWLPADDVRQAAGHPPGLRGEAPRDVRRRRSSRRPSRWPRTSRRRSRRGQPISHYKPSRAPPEGDRGRWPTKCWRRLAAAAAGVGGRSVGMRRRPRRAQARLGGNIGESMGADGQGGRVAGPHFAVPRSPRQGARADEAGDPDHRLAVAQAGPRPAPQDFGAAELDELAASSPSRGMLQPIRVRWDEAGQSWVIIAGERRLAGRLLAWAWTRCPASRRPTRRPRRYSRSARRELPAGGPRPDASRPGRSRR